MIPDETELIINHALSTKDNLSVAIKVGLAFHSLKARIISDFLHRLKSEVLAELGNQWTGGVEGEGWIGLWIRKETWPEEKLIGVGSDNTVGKNVNFWGHRFGRDPDNALIDFDEALERIGRTSRQGQQQQERCLVDVLPAASALGFRGGVVGFGRG